MSDASLTRTGTTKQAQSGFSMLELVVVVAIVGIVTVAAIPGLRTMSANNKIAAQYNKFVGTLQYVRSEAVSRNRSVTFCAVPDYTAVDPECDATADWTDGWAIFVDLDSDYDFEESGGDLLLRVGEPVGDGITMVKIPHDGSNVYSLQFNGNGRPDSAGSYSFVMCDVRGPEEARGININRTGRINRAVDSDDDGYIEDETRNPVTDCVP